jgi:hypothetical protein
MRGDVYYGVYMKRACVCEGSMVGMRRKQVYIEPEQESWLKRIAKEQQTSEAELIREALTLFSTSRPTSIHAVQDLNAWEQEKAFIRRLMRRGSVPGRRSWTREDLYEA